MFETANLAKELIANQGNEMVEVKHHIKRLKEEVKNFDIYMGETNKKHADLLEYSLKLEECLSQLKNDYRKLTDLTKKQFLETQQKLTKLSVQVEASTRESELAARERSKLGVKLDSELLEVKKMCQRAERMAARSEEEVGKMQGILKRMGERLTAEMERLREPLAAEVSKMLWENRHLAE